MTTHTPKLQWALSENTDGVLLDLCSESTCSINVNTIAVGGTSVRVSTALAPGVHFWRVTASAAGVAIPSAVSPVWEFFVGIADTNVDTSTGTVLDVNRDGFADVAVGDPGSHSVYVYLGGPTGLSNPPSQLSGPAGFGAQVTSAGDVNGDGFADLLVGTQDSQQNRAFPRSGTGSAYLFFGSDAGVIAGTDVTLTGGSYVPAPLGGWSSGGFGGSVAAAGDFNGDGFADFVVGGLPESPTGVAFTGAANLYLGSSHGAVVSPILLTGPGGLYDGDFGISVTGAGDFNGDGFGDVVVGAEQWNPAGATNNSDGVAMVFYGQAAPSGSVSGVQLLSPDETSGSWFGSTVAVAGDVNGDGYSDLLVDATLSGSAYLFLGTNSGLNGTPVEVFPSSGSADGNWGSVFTNAGDLNGDGFDDVAMSDVNYGLSASEGSVLVYLGGSGGLVTPPSSLVNPYASPTEQFGAGLAGAGDVNGDGFGDLLVGVPGGLSSGEVLIYLGAEAGLANGLVEASDAGAQDAGPDSSADANATAVTQPIVLRSPAVGSGGTFGASVE